jgi:ADP-ribose pyrophosphatase YjhB (NUDIX family)
VDVRVRALIWLSGGLVVHREHRQGRPYISLPGGRVHEGEQLAQALRREIHEELDVEIEVGPLRYVAEVVYGHVVHDLNLVFDAVVPDPAGRMRLVAMDPHSAEAAEVRPPILHHVTEIRSGAEVAPQWLGNVWRPEA